MQVFDFDEFFARSSDVIPEDHERHRHAGGKQQLHLRQTSRERLVMTEITVSISGPVGCGKSAIAGEIEIALRAVGVPVRFADEREVHSEKNMTGADWTSYLEMYEPSVVIVEQISSTLQTNLSRSEADR